MLAKLPSGDWLMLPPVMPDKAAFSATLSNCYVEKPGESVFVLLPGSSENGPSKERPVPDVPDRTDP